MRIFSTPDSITNKELTLAALIETLVAASISLAIAIRYGTTMHIALGACLAPVMLMRSNESVAKGLVWFAALYRRPWPFKTKVILAYFTIWSPFIRLFAPLRYPVAGIKSIPSNWVRVVLCEDIRTNADMLPGWGSQIHSVTKANYLRQPGPVVTAIGSLICVVLWSVKVGKWPHGSRETIFFLPFLLNGLTLLILVASPMPLYIFSYVYRLSVKSTFYIWLPIIYLVQDSYNNTNSLKANLEIMSTSALSKLSRKVSWFVIVIFAWKVILLQNVIYFWKSLPISYIIDIYVTPGEVHIWQLISVLNAVFNLTAFYYFFDTAPILLEDGALKDDVVLRRFQAFKFVRGIASIYTICVMLFLTVVSAQSIHLPNLSLQFWPSSPAAP